MNEIKNYPSANSKILQEILSDLKVIVQGRRDITYCDVINYIYREGKKGNEYDLIILWCNYKIRFGDLFLCL